MEPGISPGGCQKARAAKQKMLVVIVICGCWQEEVAMFSTVLKIGILDAESFWNIMLEHVDKSGVAFQHLLCCILFHRSGHRWAIP